MTTGWVHGKRGRAELNFSQDFIYYLVSMAPLQQETRRTCWSLDVNINLDSECSSPHNDCYSPFPSVLLPK